MRKFQREEVTAISYFFTTAREKYDNNESHLNADYCAHRLVPGYVDMDVRDSPPRCAQVGDGAGP